MNQHNLFYYRDASFTKSQIPVRTKWVRLVSYRDKASAEEEHAYKTNNGTRKGESKMNPFKF